MRRGRAETCTSEAGRCSCPRTTHAPKLVVVTGGPGAGKTAVLEVIRKNFCEHVGVLPEAASIVFGGGFPRESSLPARRAAQRAIYHVQRELEAIVLEERRVAVALCDRGTVDGLAYWPGTPESYFRGLGASLADEQRRYAAVIHLRSPSLELGYNHANPVRIESADEAAEIDARIESAWRDHPRRMVVESSVDFLEKLREAIDFIRGEVPPCCRAHRVRELSSGSRRRPSRR